MALHSPIMTTRLYGKETRTVRMNGRSVPYISHMLDSSKDMAILNWSTHNLIIWTMTQDIEIGHCVSRTNARFSILFIYICKRSTRLLYVVSIFFVNLPVNHQLYVKMYMLKVYSIAICTVIIVSIDPFAISYINMYYFIFTTSTFRCLRFNKVFVLFCLA